MADNIDIININDSALWQTSFHLVAYFCLLHASQKNQQTNKPKPVNVLSRSWSRWSLFIFVVKFEAGVVGKESVAVEKS
jgi:hypothetical protein